MPEEWFEYPLPKWRLKEIMLDCQDNSEIFWHGSASGDLRGGATGLHIGTKKAATQALEARIGIPADCEGWQGDREYGQTRLAGKKTVLKCRGEFALTGINVDAPDEDYYPKETLFYPDGTEMPFTVKPEVTPYIITGEMTNTPTNPLEDFKANASMRAQLRRGRAKRGYYYVNIGEDAGSISATVPSGYHLARVKCRGI